MMSGLLLVCTAARADEAPAQRLHAVEQEMDRSRTQQDQLTKQAEALAAELATLRADMVQAAETAQADEAALSDLERQIRSLSAEAAEKQAGVERNRGREAQLLAALARLARNPPEALAFGPESPADAIRSGLLLGAAVPQLEAEAAQLRAEIDGLKRLRAEIEQKRAAAASEQQALTEQRQRLQALIQRKAGLRDQALQAAAANREHLLALGAQAGDLRELIQRLEAERKARAEAAEREAQRRAAAAANAHAEPATQPAEVAQVPAQSERDPGRPQTIRSFAKARGAVLYPASGTLVRHFGDPNDFGIPDQGLTIEARPGAVVVAPYDGRVEFAGPFRGYGQILIIRHSDGYHSLLAGLDRIDGAVGDWVVAGEPVGAMASGDPKPRLYLELRLNGKPIDPLPWLATRDEKVSG
jgi:septal ring factor EnvC (AmiA/AmiB activator)